MIHIDALPQLCGNRVRLAWIFGARLNLGWRHDVQARATSSIFIDQLQQSCRHGEKYNLRGRFLTVYDQLKGKG